MDFPKQPLSIYVHIPFCAVKCSYCAFNIVIHRQKLIPAYVDALCRELEWVGQITTQPVHTLYFGGGTPSLLTVEQVERILQVFRRCFTVTEPLEISFEVNPEPVTIEYFLGLYKLGINRLSIGMQSAIPSELKQFARQHTYEDVQITVNNARTAGHHNLSLDLIYGAPFQTLKSWQETIARALDLKPDHLSLYALQVETGTPMAKWVDTGRVPRPDDDLAADMYDLADQLITDAGFSQYEISAWSRPGAQCQHNLQYWHGDPYLGLGAGAHGYAQGLRYQIVRPPQIYIDRINQQSDVRPFPLTDAVDNTETINRDQAMDELMMTGLRILQTGIDRSKFEQRFGVSVDSVYGAELNRLAALGMIEVDDSRIRLTRAARLISNQVLVHFIRLKPNQITER